MDLTEIWCGDASRIQLAQDGVQQWGFVKTVMNFLVT
jgi:hypothetical protein